MSWLKYVQKGNGIYLTEPNKFTTTIIDILPDYVDSILEIGCTNGRDFKQFENKYKLYGIDLFPKNNIDWIGDDTKVVYYQSTLANFLNILNKQEFKDLSKFVFLSHFTLSYDPKYTIPILEKLMANGCKNIILKEPLPENNYTHSINLKHLKKLFLTKKSGWDRKDSTYICCYVDNDDKEKINNYLENSTDAKL